MDAAVDTHDKGARSWRLLTRMKPVIVGAENVAFDSTMVIVIASVPMNSMLQDSNNWVEQDHGRGNNTAYEQALKSLYDGKSNFKRLLFLMAKTTCILSVFSSPRD